MTSPQATHELVVAPAPSIAHDPQNWGAVLDLLCDLTLELPVPEFTVADLLRLGSGSVLETRCANGDDVPVRINGALIAWSEFEVVGDRLAVRITEWA